VVMVAMMICFSGTGLAPGWRVSAYLAVILATWQYPDLGNTLPLPLAPVRSDNTRRFLIEIYIPLDLRHLTLELGMG
jgi:hypothetical protein